MYKNLKDLSIEEQGALVVNSLIKGETIHVDGYDYLVKQKTKEKTVIKNIKTNKNGLILHVGGQNVAWMKNRKDGVATGFFRGIESDITRSLLDEGNFLGSLETESYIRAKKELINNFQK